MTWQDKPENYEPIDFVDNYLRNLVNPTVGTAEFKMVVMHQFNKSPQDVGLTRAQARELIERRIVPEEFYTAVIAVACS